ncbi:MAG: YgaP family membrane protein [Spirochaetota bacterium]
MKKNMGNVDRVIRVILGVLIVIFFAAGELTGTAAVVLGIVAAVLLITSVVGTCPLYVPFRISTLKQKNEKDNQ